MATQARRRLDTELTLLPDEHILHTTNRHWIIYARTLVIPVIIFLVAAITATYRALGGQFGVTGVDLGGELDATNIILGVLVGLGVLAWGAARRRAGKKVQASSGLGWLALALLAGGSLYFRWIGGELFHINPAEGRPFDLWNILLYTVCLLMIGLGVYLYFDWENDELILTNMRVVDNDEVFLIQVDQKQLMIDDIQDVTITSSNFLERALKYGTIKITTASPQIMLFEAAQDPLTIQRKIRDEVYRTRNQRIDTQLRRLIRQEVYGERDLERQGPADDARPGRALLFLPPNPQYDPRSLTYTWRQHWLFLLGDVIWPTVALFGGLVAMVTLLQSGADVLAILLGGIVGLGAIAFWYWYAWEDYLNDIYQLTMTNIIDRAMKPLGAESIKQASLGAIQDANFETTFWGRILGYGDVTVRTAGAARPFTFERVPNPSAVLDHITAYQAFWRKTEKERAARDAAVLIRQYHEEQLRRGELNLNGNNGPKKP